MTMTFEEFLESETEIFIHCPTLDSAEYLCLKLDEAGRKWKMGRYPGNHHWNDFKEATCYSNDGRYTSIKIIKKYYTEEEEILIKFSDIDFTKFNSTRQTLIRKICAITKKRRKQRQHKEDM